VLGMLVSDRGTEAGGEEEEGQGQGQGRDWQREWERERERRRRWWWMEMGASSVLMFGVSASIVRLREPFVPVHT